MKISLRIFKRTVLEVQGLSFSIDKQLFAKIYTIWEWDTASNSYVEKITEPSSEDITEKRGAAPGLPAVWPSSPRIWAITDCTGEKCVPGTPDTVSINGIDGNGLTSTGSAEPINVVGYGGQLRATLQFFGTADKNTGPIRNVIVDWNDGRGFGGNNPGRYKNYLGREACDNSDFAHSTDACTEDYFYFTHTYTCNRGSLPRPCLDPLTDSHCFAQDSCPENVNAGVEGNGSCCVFKPRVQLKDNWGWCNGTCPGPPGPTSEGCYEEECRMGRSEDHWTYFAGKVIVVPKD